MSEQHNTDWRDLEIGQKAKYAYGWSHSSKRYVGQVGVIVDISSSACGIMFPDGERIGPTPRQVTIVHEFDNNEEALKLLNTKGDGYD